VVTAAVAIVSGREAARRRERGSESMLRAEG